MVSYVRVLNLSTQTHLYKRACQSSIGNYVALMRQHFFKGAIKRAKCDGKLPENPINQTESQTAWALL